MPRCKAIKRTGEQCKNNAIRGGTVCAQAHGGSAPQVRLAAKRRIVTQEATALVAQYTPEPMDDPATELLTVANEFLALKTELGRRASELQSLSVTSRDGIEQVASVLQAYQSSLVQVADVLVKINRLGLEHRRVQVAEKDLQVFIEAVKAGVYCSEAHLTWDQSQAVLQVISDQLRGI
jgi:hypothetical protein